MYTEREPHLPHQEQIHADKLGVTLRFRDYTIDNNQTRSHGEEGSKDVPEDSK